MMPTVRSIAAMCAAVLAVCAPAFRFPSALAGDQPPRPACASSGQSLGVSRIIEIDARTGALFGGISTQQREPRFLGPKEVVLTFDDGPMPAVTKPILDTLDRFCTKATFFSVGRMAIAYPATTREIMARGHTLGTHTWSHPLNLKRLPFERARDEIEKGHAAVTLAAGKPIAPFFRFPGLSDSGPLLGHLQERGVASFTVDVVSNDSYISDGDRLLQRTLREVETNNGGIVLFHDIKAATARILPRFLQELQERGYKVVHIRPKAPVVPVETFNPALTAMLAKSERDTKAQPLMPFFGRAEGAEPAGAEAVAEPAGAAIPVAALAPAPRQRDAGSAPASKSRVVSRKPNTEVRGWLGTGSDEPESKKSPWRATLSP
jgi:peptidoglycan/xylan/chitin deacetylase (PgdA/CDA1 family)